MPWLITTSTLVACQNVALSKSSVYWVFDIVPLSNILYSMSSLFDELSLLLAIEYITGEMAPAIDTRGILNDASVTCAMITSREKWRQ